MTPLVWALPPSGPCPWLQTIEVHSSAPTPAGTAKCLAVEFRDLVMLLGDQLDLGAAALGCFDRSVDPMRMAESSDESTHVWSGKPSTARFLAAMRHFAEDLRAAAYPLHDTRLTASGPAHRLPDLLLAGILRQRLRRQRYAVPP